MEGHPIRRNLKGITSLALELPPVSLAGFASLP